MFHKVLRNRRDCSMHCLLVFSRNMSMVVIFVKRVIYHKKLTSPYSVVTDYYTS